MTSVQKAWVTPMLYQSRDLNTFKAYCQDIQDHLDLAMTRTTDTGQIVISTMALPTWSTTNMVGYLIYKFNDPLQATAPIFVRLEFWTMIESATGSLDSSGQGQGYLQTRFIIGTGSNGSGTITNPSATFYSPVSGSQNPGAIVAEAASRSADRVGANFMSYSSSQGFLLLVYGSGATYRVGTGNTGLDFLLATIVIQRTVDDYGQPDGRGIVVLGKIDVWDHSADPNQTQTYLVSTTSWTSPAYTNFLTQETGEISSSYYQTSDNKYLVFPMNYWDPLLGVRSHPAILFMPALADYTGSIYTIETIPNRPRRYRSIGVPSKWRPTARAYGDFSCLVLWE